MGFAKARPIDVKTSSLVCIYILVGMYVCGVIISVRRELNYFERRKVMVVMHMRIRPHCTVDLTDNWSVGKA